MSAYAPGFRRSFTANLVERAELFRLYRELLQGTVVGDLRDPDCHVDFRLQGILECLHVEVKAEPDLRILAHAFQVHLKASREARMGFIFVCVGDPPREDDPCAKLLESFDVYGGWVGEDICAPLRGKLITSFQHARSLFPPGSFPKKPLLSAWQETHTVGR